VARLFVHHLEFLGASEHGEVCVLYVSGFVAVAVAGAGRFSVDHLLSRRMALQIGR